MSKTLVIAEKPSVGGDLARVLKGPFKKQEGFLEGPDHVVTWAVGHLVQLADPDEYDPKFKTWRMPDLPIVPDKFKLVVRDERSRKQMSVVTKQLGREDVDEVVNACDAGREGELIFAYLYEKAKAKKPVQRLWLNSMTNAAMKDAFKELRPASEFAKLEQAARSRSEADWIVGMNATRAATIRLRSSFDGAVSLGRVQTPTLAIIARREEEIRAFKPEPYWLVDATFAAGPLAGAEGNGAGASGDGTGGAENGVEPGTDGDGANPERSYVGRFHAGTKPRIASEAEAVAIVEACEGKHGKITKLEKKKQKERAPMLYDLTTLQREANTRYGFSARRTLSAAQRLYEEHKALTYPRTNSRYLTTDMVEEIKPIAELVGGQADYRKAAEYVTGLSELPLERVVNNAKVTDHHAIIPTRSEHNVERMGSDDKRIYDMAVRRFLAVFHPEAVFENTKIETTVPAGPDEKDGGYVFRTRGKLLLTPGWRGVYGEAAADAAKPEKEKAGEEDEGTNQQLPRLEQGEDVETRKIASARKETKPPRRYSDASLLGAMETAGKLVDDEELREAMKDSGIGTPATRAAIIERLIQVGYVERDARSLVASEKGLNVIRLLNAHALTSPELTGNWEHRLGKIERGEDSREAFMGDIAGFAKETITELDETLKDVKIPRAKLGPCPICGHEIVENRKGYSCWARNDPGCGFVIWKSKAGKTLPIPIARELIKTGYTSRAVTGFKGRSGRSFRAHLAMSQTEEGKWRVEFNEEWAKEGAKPPDAETEAEAGAEGAVAVVEAKSAA
jgi:DNA topoisomerase III